MDNKVGLALWITCSKTWWDKNTTSTTTTVTWHLKNIEIQKGGHEEHNEGEREDTTIYREREREERRARLGKEARENFSHLAIQTVAINSKYSN